MTSQLTSTSLTYIFSDISSHWQAGTLNQENRLTLHNSLFLGLVLFSWHSKLNCGTVRLCSVRTCHFHTRPQMNPRIASSVKSWLQLQASRPRCALALVAVTPLGRTGLLFPHWHKSWGPGACRAYCWVELHSISKLQCKWRFLALCCR